MKTNNSVFESDDALRYYFREISRTPLLSFEEELELSRQVQTGNKMAREKLIKANLRLVVKIAKAYQSSGMAFQDLVQEGNLGLLNAAGKYDFSHNVRFSTYASWWIKQAIVRAIATKKRLIRLPHRKEDSLRKIQAFLSRYQAEWGRQPEVSEIMDHLHLGREEVLSLLEIAEPVNSLDKEVNEESGTMMDLVEDRHYMPETHLMEESMKDDTQKLMKHLMDREREILFQRFAFYGGKKKTLKTIGQEMNLSAETVRQISIRALEKLRHHGDQVQEYLYN